MFWFRFSGFKPNFQSISFVRAFFSDGASSGEEIPQIFACDLAVVPDGDAEVVDVGGVEVGEDVGEEEGVDGEVEPAGPVRLAARADEDQAERDLRRGVGTLIAKQRKDRER